MCAYTEQNNVTKNGTLKSTRKPWKMERITNCCPEYRVIMGKVVSIVVAPPTEIGASLPKYFTKSGAQSNAIISLLMFESNPRNQ